MRDDGVLADLIELDVPPSNDFTGARNFGAPASQVRDLGAIQKHTTLSILYPAQCRSLPLSKTRRYVRAFVLSWRRTCPSGVSVK